MEKPEKEIGKEEGDKGGCSSTTSTNWSEAVEDLVAARDTDAAISLLEATVSQLESQEPTSESVNLQLASALTNLANLYSSKGFSLKSDQLLSRAFRLREAKSGRKDLKKESCNDCAHNKLSNDGNTENSRKSLDAGLAQNGSSDDDWEAIADREPNGLLSSYQCLPEASNLSLEDTKVQAPKRRGRGTFSYKKNEMYSDRQYDKSVVEDAEGEVVVNSERNSNLRHSHYGTRHVLVLANFSPTTKTIDLEKLLEEFRDHGFVIRWVNDTVALAVFRSPSIALEAHNRICCPFTVRILDEDDNLLPSISARDLEPPRQRPQTSARTAQRLIAQGMGLKLPSTFGSRELKNQEEARRNRIQTRQKLKDDAWGPDDAN